MPEPFEKLLPGGGSNSVFIDVYNCSSPSNMTVPELKPTKLGTRQYWNDVYEEEMRNFDEIGDEGEVWFGLETSEKMVNWALEHVPPSSRPTILEVGSGNGVLLLGLLEAGYDSILHGIDYSDAAVKLAEAVAKNRGGSSSITYTHCDFLVDDPPPPNPSSDSGTANWDLIMDKGTYDAIALGARDADGRSPAIHYPGRVASLLKPDGIFLITSCNFTEEELKECFISESTRLKYHSRIQHPVYTYAGSSGSVCSSVAFQKS